MDGLMIQGFGLAPGGRRGRWSGCFLCSRRNSGSGTSVSGGVRSRKQVGKNKGCCAACVGRVESRPTTGVFFPSVRALSVLSLFLGTIYLWL